MSSIVTTHQCVLKDVKSMLRTIDMTCFENHLSAKDLENILQKTLTQKNPQDTRVVRLCGAYQFYIPLSSSFKEASFRFLCFEPECLKNCLKASIDAQKKTWTFEEDKDDDLVDHYRK